MKKKKAQREEVGTADLNYVGVLARIFWRFENCERNDIAHSTRDRAPNVTHKIS